MKTSGFILRFVLLFVVLICVSLAALLIGSVKVSLSDLMNLILFNQSTDLIKQVILQVRLPRILLSVAVGGGLAVTGGVFQAILMNPLAEPYILGISSGASFGAVLSFVIGLGFWGSQVFSFFGALAVIFLVFLFGKRFGELEPNVLILSGVMVGAFFSAVILILVTMLNDTLRTAVFWLMGNLSIADSSVAYYVLPISVVISSLLCFNGQKYNVLSLGNSTAQQLGINTIYLKRFTYLAASLLIGVLVSVTGIIGFVGLLIPHLCRLLFGSDNRIVLPASFFIGGAYLVFADTIARTIISPAEIPVGAITASIGAPIFIYLLKLRYR